MRRPDKISDKIYTLPQLLQEVRRWKFLGKTIAFTNGCFDILHKGHLYSLSLAAKEADYLVVGVNADASVRTLKGAGRPYNDQESRSLLLATLVIVDAVIIFEEDTPIKLIQAIEPDVLIKGGDYKIDQIVGSKEVLASGGKVVINPLLEGFSTTGILKKTGV